MCDNFMSVLFRNIIQYIFSYCLKYSSWLCIALKYVFFIKEVVFLSWIFALLQKTEHSDLQSEHRSFFDTDVDCTCSPRTKIWNIFQFGRTCGSDFTAHNCSKYINCLIIIFWRKNKKNYISYHLHPK